MSRKKLDESLRCVRQSYSIHKDDIAKIKELAESEGVPKSTIFKRALKKYFESFDKNVLDAILKNDK